MMVRYRTTVIPGPWMEAEGDEIEIDREAVLDVLRVPFERPSLRCPDCNGPTRADHDSWHCDPCGISF